MKESRDERHLDHDETKLIHKIKGATKHLFRHIPGKKTIITAILILTSLHNTFAKQIPQAQLGKLKHDVEMGIVNEQDASKKLDKDYQLIELTISKMLEEHKHFEALSKIMHLKDSIKRSGMLRDADWSKLYNQLSKLEEDCRKHPSESAMQRNLKPGLYNLDGHVVYVGYGDPRLNADLTVAILNFAENKFGRGRRMRVYSTDKPPSLMSYTITPNSHCVFVKWVTAKQTYELDGRQINFELNVKDFPKF